jgi:DNA-binding transcriptional ArsR family regulator
MIIVAEPLAPVFKALADEHRRALLDALRERDGQTLGELCEVAPDMTRFGVMKHLQVLEDAHLVVTERDGRSKRHYLNAVPIREIHDRWISRYAEPHVAGLLELRDRAEGA